MNDDEIYQSIFEELENKKLVGSTWVQAIEIAGGDEQAAKARYISLRYESIKNESDRVAIRTALASEELALLNKVRFQATKDNALASLSSLRYWYEHTYDGGEVLSDVQLQKILELSRSSESKKPTVPERYRTPTQQKTTVSQSNNLSSNDKNYSKSEQHPNTTNNQTNESSSQNAKLRTIRWIIPIIIGIFLTKLLGLAGTLAAIGIYALTVSKMGIITASIVSIATGFVTSLILASLLL